MKPRPWTGGKSCGTELVDKFGDKPLRRQKNPPLVRASQNTLSHGHIGMQEQEIAMDEWNGDSKPCIPCVCLRLDVSSVWSAEFSLKTCSNQRPTGQKLWAMAALLCRVEIWLQNVAPPVVGFGDPYPVRRHLSLSIWVIWVIFQEVYEGMEHGWVPGARNLVMKSSLFLKMFCHQGGHEKLVGIPHHHPIRIRPVKSLAVESIRSVKHHPKKIHGAKWIFFKSFLPSVPLIKTIILYHFLCLILNHFFHHLTEFEASKTQPALRSWSPKPGRLWSWSYLELIG